MIKYNSKKEIGARDRAWMEVPPLTRDLQSQRLRLEEFCDVALRVDPAPKEPRAHAGGGAARCKLELKRTGSRGAQDRTAPWSRSHA